MRRLTAGLWFVCMMFCLGVPALAGEGRIPIWQPLTIGPGQEGNYVLTRDISQAPGAPAIDILAGTGTVEIDLNGFTISGAGSGTADIIRAQGVARLTVRNGTLIGTVSGDAIDAAGCDKVVIEDIVARGVNSHVAFDLDLVNHFKIRRSLVHRWSICIEATGGVHGEIEANQIRSCEGIWVDAFNVAVHDNRLKGTGPAIYIDYADTCLVADNLVGDVNYNDQDGIVVRGDICNVLGNVIKLQASQGDGIVLHSSFGVVRDNAVMAAGNGLTVYGIANQIEGNVFSANAKAGIWFTSSSNDNTYGHNTLRWNGVAPGPCTSTPPACGVPDVCDDGTNNTSFSDNMGPGPGC